MRLLLIIIFFSIPGYISAEFDHQYKSLNQLLTKYITYQNNKSVVDYKNLRKKDLKNIKKINLVLSKVSKDTFESWSDYQRLAFLINAYNSFTLQVIANYHPIDSPRDLDFKGKSLWDYKFFNLFGERVSLNFLEHDLIRKNFKEPRIHFLVNCAAKSCPPLQPQALTSQNLGALLETATEGFIYDIDRNYFDSKKNILKVSQIFNWYREDFVKEDSSLIEYFKQFFPVVNEKTKVEFLEYNWLLNIK